MKKWRAYERLVAMMLTGEYDSSFTVVPNARITGLLSGRKRQIDVLVDFRYDCDMDRRIIVDAKDGRRKVDIKEVEAFEGLMRDVQARYGFLVCSAGHTKAAKTRAQDSIGIRLVSSDEVEKLDLDSWDACLSPDCLQGLVLWDANPSLLINNSIWHINAVGKCDECGLFHVWCWGCGQRKVLAREDEWHCGCSVPWFWLTSIEDDAILDGKTTNGNYLLFVLNETNYQVVDRRPL